MDKYPPHSKNNFFKYLSIDTAKLVLINKKFRYSSPLLFNDPFDVQTELTFNFDINSFHKTIVTEMIRLASSNDSFPYEEESDFIKSIKLLRVHIRKEGKVNSLLENGLLVTNKDTNRILEEERINYNNLWKEFLKPLRVFSLSTKHDNILMWSHYAENHTGVVFKLKVLPKEDNLICVAEPIIYKKEPLTFFSEKMLINDMFGIKKLDYTKLYRNYAKIKSKLWEYENEWRVWTFEWEHQNQLFTDYKLFPDELESIYFGCNTKAKDIEEIKNLSLNINSKISFHKAKKQIGKYALQFDQI